jgi:uncharacterized small protein (DUF1192 family)
VFLVTAGVPQSKDISRLLSKGQEKFDNVVAGPGGAVARVTKRAAAGKIAAEERAMPALDDDDKPKKKIAHEIGQDLTLLSAAELADRIALLKDEIVRLEADMAKKQTVKSAADRFFKK